MSKNIGYGPIPWWFWNDRMESKEILRQLHEMADKGLSDVVLHARFGLDPKFYLSQEWFGQVGLVLNEAKKLGIKIWIYDEYNWPSGSAAGRVQKENPDWEEHYLVLISSDINGPADIWQPIPRGIPVAILLTDASGTDSRDVSGNIQGDFLCLSVPEGKWTINYFVMRSCGPVMPYTLGGYIIDHANADATRAFLKYTHEEYAARYKSEFGKNILGFFTDEPGFYQYYRNADQQTLPWSPGFSAEFMRRKAYRIEPHLPKLWRDIGDDFWVHRCNYYDVISQLFQENYWDIMQKWCQENEVLLVGHPNGAVRGDVLQASTRYTGNNMEMFRRMSIPGMDRINRDPAFITEKITSSVSHLTDKPRASSETFGCFDWHLTLQEMKEWTNRQFVRGINMLFLHAFYYSIEGFRREESPPSLFFQNLFWPYFKKYSDYVRRLAAELSQGLHVAPIAVYYPIVSAFGDCRAGDYTGIDPLDRSLRNVCALLSEHQWDFDILDDRMICDGNIKEGRLQFGPEAFSVLILPKTTILPANTARKICAFLKGGGRVISTDELPKRILGVNSEEGEKLVSDLRKHFSNLSAFENNPADKVRGVNIGGILAPIVDSKVHYYGAMGREAKDNNGIGAMLWILDGILEKDLCLGKHIPAVKCLHKRRAHGDIYFIANEGEAAVNTPAVLRADHRPVLMDCESGLVSNLRNCKRINKDHWQIVISILPGSAQLLLCLDTEKGKYEFAGARPELETVFSMTDLWDLSLDGKKHKTVLRPWDELGHPYFSGTAIYETDFLLPALKKDKRYFIDLGEVKEIARLELNNKLMGIATWRPFVFEITDGLKQGANHLRIEVTNTLANQFHRQVRPSGLLGPVDVKTETCGAVHDV